MTLRLLLVFCLGVPALAQTIADSAKLANPPVADAKASAADPLVSAQALLKKGEYADAAAAFKSIVEKDPTSAEAQAGLVRSLLRARNFDEPKKQARRPSQPSLRPPLFMQLSAT
jgi:thioredoxin-like negative regulator of GroEL